MNSLVLGVDVGGSHLTAAIVKTKEGLVDKKTRIRKTIDSKASANDIINSWSEVINNVCDSYPVQEKLIGLAMPGPFDYVKGVSRITGLNKYESLYLLNVKELLANQLQIPKQNIRMINDAAAFLRGEVYYGAAQKMNDVIGITLGTGTGTARHHNGITEDANLGPSPYMDSIADDYFSTRWFIKQYYQSTGIMLSNVKELAALYFKKEEVRGIFNEFTDHFAFFISLFVKTDSPQALVLGGNISQCAHLFHSALVDKLKRHGVEIPILLAELGEDAPILGATSLFQSPTIGKAII